MDNYTEKRNIAFIGARAAGKSRMSRKVSKLTGRVALSTDNLISYEAGGLTVDEIVRREGWKGFRDREYDILRKLASMKDVIIDCGGGILIEPPLPDDPEKRELRSARKIELLKESCYVVYLKRSAAWLLDKTFRKDAQRPELEGAYETLLARRFPLYEEVSDLVLDLDLLDMDDAIRMVVSGISPALT